MRGIVDEIEVSNLPQQNSKEEPSIKHAKRLSSEGAVVRVLSSHHFCDRGSNPGLGTVRRF